MRKVLEMALKQRWVDSIPMNKEEREMNKGKKNQKWDVQAASRKTKEGETNDVVVAISWEDEPNYQAKQG